MNKQPYGRATFHWSYIFGAIFSPLIVLMWLHNLIDPKTDTRTFMGAARALFNHHEHSYNKKIIAAETELSIYYQCDNLDCNMARPELKPFDVNVRLKP